MGSKFAVDLSGRPYSILAVSVLALAEIWVEYLR